MPVSVTCSVSRFSQSVGVFGVREEFREFWQAVPVDGDYGRFSGSTTQRKPVWNAPVSSSPFMRALTR